MSEPADIWTIKAALDWTVGFLERKGDEHARLSAEWLLSEATGLRRIDLYVNFERPLSMGERDVLRDFVARRASGEPLQYITGEVAFRHIAVKVRPGVLIPRPETEVLVSEALALLPAPERRCAVDSLSYTELEELLAPKEGADESLDSEEGAQELLVPKEKAEEPLALESTARSSGALALDSSCAPLVADLCTGSGCIACSVAYERPRARVVATDLSPEAVALARENVAALGLEDRVRVLQCNLADGIPERLNESFDLVVSNPPYIPDRVMENLPSEVSDFEPELALAGGPDGLDVFREMLPAMRRLLRAGGAFACELHEECLDEAAALARDAGYASVEVKTDLTGRPRILIGRKL